MERAKESRERKGESDMTIGEILRNYEENGVRVVLSDGKIVGYEKENY